MMEWLKTLTGYATPMFLVLSPVLSYGDQIMSMQRSKSSAGFSLDIPLIMLIASIMRIFYYPGARYDSALLLQSILMVAVQIILLKTALDHRPPPSSKGGDAATPFAAARDGKWDWSRPYSFWQWRSPRPYWQFIIYMFFALLVCELILSPVHSIYPAYSLLIGYTGLSVEATLPIPQILENARSKSCKGFRVSVLANWLVGDFMKIYWFFTSPTMIPWAFKLSGCFQACCDFLLAMQYLLYGAGPNKTQPWVELDEGNILGGDSSRLEKR